MPRKTKAESKVASLKTPSKKPASKKQSRNHVVEINFLGKWFCRGLTYAQAFPDKDFYEDLLQEVLTHFRDTIQTKNENYGKSAASPPILAPEITANKAIKIRMSDKIARIISLQKRENEALSGLSYTASTENDDLNLTTLHESLDDTYFDLAGYCLLYLTNRINSQMRDAFLSQFGFDIEKEIQHQKNQSEEPNEAENE